MDLHKDTRSRHAGHRDISPARRTATITVLFCDLVASTERHHHLGDDAADDFRRLFFATLHDAAAATHGEVVKTTGDGMMIVFRDSAVDAVACAARILDDVEVLDVEPRAYMRVGISAGESTRENDDWFGTPVIEAARLCARAGTGQALLTDVVRVLVGTRGRHHLRSLGPVTLKGIAQPVTLAEIVRTPWAAPSPTRTTRKPPDRRRLWAAAAALLTIAGLLVFVTARSRVTDAPRRATSYTPRVEHTACNSSVGALVPNATCGSLAVPENRAVPNGRWIRVKFTRYPARHESTNPPVIELATALDAAQIVDDPAQSPVRDAADLIVFGGRGLNSSSPALTCPEFAAISPDLIGHSEKDAPAIETAQATLRACHDRLLHQGVALDHYSVTDEAGDVVDLIRALGLRNANLQGVWDSARVALAVARKEPDVVRSLFLLDPEVPGSSFMAHPLRSLAGAFDRYVRLCDSDRRCHAAYPDLPEKFRAYVERQAARPQTVIPVDLISGTLHVTVAHPPVFLDGDRVAQGLAAAFTSTSKNMPLVAAGIEHPDATLNASLALAQNFPLVLKDFPWGGFLSRMCSYEIHTRSVGATLEASTRGEFAGYDDPAFRWMCAAWDVPQLQPDAFTPVSSDAPTLVVEQQLDPRWEPNVAMQLRAGLTNLNLLSFPTLPGGAAPGDFPRCYNELRRQFVRDPSRTLDTAPCAHKSPRIDFLVPTP